MTDDLDALRSRLESLRAELARERHLARHDPLTGALNRRGGMEALAELQPPYSLALVDLDHFRTVNHLPGGYATGDQVLLDMSRLLASDGRAEDRLIRWGGEEFLLVLAGADADGTRVRLQRFLGEAHRLIGIGRVMVTFSAGVAVVPACGGFATAFAEANHALRRAKTDGRARIVVASGPRAA